MKSIKIIAATIALATVSFGSLAQTVSVTSDTLSNAEAQIAAKAQQSGATYKILEANTNNRVHMTAQLIK